MTTTPLLPMQGSNCMPVVVAFPCGVTRRGSLRTAGREFVTVWVGTELLTVHLSRVQRITA